MIKIRIAKTNDKKALQNLNDKAFCDNPKFDSDLDLNWAQGEHGDRYFTETLNDPEAYCIIAYDGDINVGYLAASEKKINHRNSHYVELQNMGVIPEYRLQKIGTLLINEFFTWAKTKGFEKVILNAYIANTGALEFYKRHGLTEIDISLEKML